MKKRIEVRHTGTGLQRVPDEAIEAARAFIGVAVGLHKADAVTRLHPNYDHHASRFALALQLLTQTYFADVLREDENAHITSATIPSAFGTAMALATCTLLGMRPPKPGDASLALTTMALAYFSALNAFMDGAS